MDEKELTEYLQSDRGKEYLKAAGFLDSESVTNLVNEKTLGLVNKRDQLLGEVKEETGLEALRNVIGPVYSFRFVKNRVEFHEEVYGAEIGNVAITLSSEHSEYRWVTLKEALQLIRYVQNKRGLCRLEEQLRH